MTTIRLAVCIATLLFASLTQATEITYTPMNPSFGGNTFNGAWMMNQAQIQNKFTEKPGAIKAVSDPLKDFENSMVRRILSVLSSRIIDTAFGVSSDGLTSGTYDFGDYSIDISVVEDAQISVSIIDNALGTSTQVEIPYYGTTP